MPLLCTPSDSPELWVQYDPQAEVIQIIDGPHVTRCVWHTLAHALHARVEFRGSYWQTHALC